MKKNKIVVCLIVFGGLSLSVLYGYFAEGVANKLDDSFLAALLEALVRRFI